MKSTLIPLGTASAMPTTERNLPATALERKGQVLLFDCGEGTQFQFLRAGIKRSRIDAICLSHLHGDHIYGVFGMLSTMGQLGRERPIHLIAPARFRQALFNVPGFENEWLPFEIIFVPLQAGMDESPVYETDELTVVASELDHRVLSFGLRIEEKPRPGRLDPERARALGADPVEHFSRLKQGEDVELPDGSVISSEEVVGSERAGISVAYISDTRPCEASVTLAREVDVLYHEATFGQDLQDRAAETGHSTAREAAQVAEKASPEKLLISHFSARYTDSDVLVQEARQVFENTEAAEELKRYALDPRVKWNED